MTNLIMTVLAQNRQIKSVIKLGAKVNGYGEILGNRFLSLKRKDS